MCVYGVCVCNFFFSVNFNYILLDLQNIVMKIKEEKKIERKKKKKKKILVTVLVGCRKCSATMCI